ncbi:MAG: hypothetical protein U1F57_05920 [bacterium]
MAEPVKGSTQSELYTPGFSWGPNVAVGGGAGYRSDGTQTAWGPQLEVDAGFFFKIDQNWVGGNFFFNHLNLQSPLFGLPQGVAVNTFGAKLNYGHAFGEMFSLKTQLGLGLAIYGVGSPEEIGNGIYINRTGAGPHVDLGAGACVWKDRFCALASYNFDINAFREKKSDLKLDYPNLTTKTLGAQGLGLLLSVDVARFF